MVLFQETLFFLSNLFIFSSSALRTLPPLLPTTLHYKKARVIFNYYPQINSQLPQPEDRSPVLYMIYRHCTFQDLPVRVILFSIRSD